MAVNCDSLELFSAKVKSSACLMNCPALTEIATATKVGETLDLSGTGVVICRDDAAGDVVPRDRRESVFCEELGLPPNLSVAGMLAESAKEKLSLLLLGKTGRAECLGRGGTVKGAEALKEQAALAGRITGPFALLCQRVEFPDDETLAAAGPPFWKVRGAFCSPVPAGRIPGR